MQFCIDSSKLFELVAQVLETEFTDQIETTDEIGIKEEIKMAHEHVMRLRKQVHQYDSNHRADEFKPCINYRVIANQIVQELSERHQVAYVHRVCAYKTIFIMYLICRLLPPIRQSWWERRFLEELPSYLERTDFFRNVNCKHRLHVILDQLPQDGVLPMEVERIVPNPKPNYPLLGPVQIFNRCTIINISKNEQCQQFLAPVNNSVFKEAVV